MAANADIIDNAHQLLNVNMVNITKLTSTNYMIWSLQVRSLLEGYDLAGYLDGTASTNNNVTTTNPAYTTWRRQDKLIFSGLLGTLSPSIQPLVSKAKTSAEIWKSVAATYANPSRGHTQQLRLQLKHYIKGDKSIDLYMQGLTTRFDQLALLGKPVEHEEQIEFILGGLPEDYKSVVDQVEGRETSPSIIEVHEKLVNKEAKLLATSLAVATVTPTWKTCFFICKCIWRLSVLGFLSDLSDSVRQISWELKKPNKFNYLLNRYSFIITALLLI